MCGIIGYIGEKQAYPILIDGLSKLEYRGYDSAGVALLDEDQLEIMKSVGRLSKLEEKIGEQVPSAPWESAIPVGPPTDAPAT